MPAAENPPTAPGRARLEAVRAAVVRALHSAWFAYLTLAFFQLRVVWGAWVYRDLTSGDTAGYYIIASGWARGLTVNAAWSPLYTAFYGTVLWFCRDLYTATLVHRLLIVFAASLMVLALFRRLLPPALAWLAAAWWAALPINFDTLYEVHLFAVLPVLAAWLLLLARPSPWKRGAALAVLAASAVLVRNELAVAFGLVALLCLLYERREARAAAPGGPSAWRRWPAYAAPLAAAALLWAGTYARSTDQGAALSYTFKIKHTLNMAQVYSYGYQQRHPEWKDSPWTGYADLMTKTFGKPLPSLAEMIRRNPREVFRHFGWNVGLLPSGLELLLFDATAGTVNPDYVPEPLGVKDTRTWSFLLVGLILVGGALILARWGRWREHWFQGRGLGWLSMLAFLPVAALIVATQRPRPSYLFPLSLTVMAAAGTTAHALLRELRLSRPLSALAPLVMVVCCCLARPHYGTAEDVPPSQPCRVAVERLLPYRDLIARPRVTLLIGNYHGEIGLYVGEGKCMMVGYDALGRWKRDVPLETFLAQEKIDFFYLDERLWLSLEAENSPTGRSFLAPTAPVGWERLGGGDAPGDRWRLFRRP